MSRYAVDEERGVLLAVWSTGRGDRATTVTATPAGCSPVLLGTLVAALTALSRDAWRTYTHPVAAAEGLEPEGEGWQRDQGRTALADVVAAVTQADLPEDGAPAEAESPMVGGAHQIGRVLREIGDGALTAAVAEEVAAELSAIERAELGDLSGRACQAVELSRQDASPLQVREADRILHEQPFGGGDLFTQVDPSAAAVAAAHWLRAAAAVAATASGMEPLDVVAEADDIEAFPHITSSMMVSLLADGITPRIAVSELIGNAMLVADGILPDPAGLIEAFTEASEQAAEIMEQQQVPDAVITVRATPLDPTRPALDLLEDLLAGIRGCWLVFRDHVLDDATWQSAAPSDAARGAAARERFLDLVRAEAAGHPE